MPSLSGILETALHVDDISRSSRFYEQILGLQRIAGDHRFRAYSVAGRDVLLLFQRDTTQQPLTLPGGVRELREVVKRFPGTEEDRRARAKLNELGVAVTATR